MHTRELGISRYRKTLLNLHRAQTEFDQLRMAAATLTPGADVPMERAYRGLLLLEARVKGMEQALCLSRRQIAQYRKAAKL